VKPRRFSSEGIILRRRNYSEADRILVIFSKHYGKISIIAKGVRKLKSRKRGSLEIFSQVEFSAARGKNLDLITEVEMINYFDCLREDLKKVSVAYYFMEVVQKLTQEGEENAKLYSLILETLDDLKTTKLLRKLRYKFVYQILVLLGFWPEGKEMVDPDKIVMEVVERELFSVRVGKKLVS